MRLHLLYQLLCGRLLAGPPRRGNLESGDGDLAGRELQWSEAPRPQEPAGGSPVFPDRMTRHSRRAGGVAEKPRPSHDPRVQSQLALRLLAEASGVKRVGLAPVNPENS